jgi:hypothetical protein
VPSSFQYPVERHRDLQRRWGRLLQRTAAPNAARNNNRAEQDHDRLERYRSARDQAATGGLKAAPGSGSLDRLA